MRLLRSTLAATAAFFFVTSPIVAQTPLLLNRPAGGMGLDFRQYSFGDGYAVDNTKQFAIPFAIAVPIGQRLTLDFGGAWASTTVESAGSDASVDGFTDTQLRASYVFGSDALVASVSVNLPTGKETTNNEEFTAVSSVASNFLLFPVNTYGNGTSVTGGLAGVLRAGAWNLGAAMSARWNATYEPFSETGQDLEYDPGVEGRLRLGADRLIGRSRLTLGFTVSTFGDDKFAGGGVVPGTYSPGTRFIGEASYAFPMGNGQMQLFAWDYYRSDGEADAASSANKENIFTVGAAGGFPIGKLSLDPALDARIWSPEVGSGYLIGGQLGLRVPLGVHGSMAPTVRYDRGSITDDTDTDFSVNGVEVSVYFRYAL